MKLSFNKTREAKIQSRASQTPRTSIHYKHQYKQNRPKTRKKLIPPSRRRFKSKGSSNTSGGWLRTPTGTGGNKNDRMGVWKEEDRGLIERMGGRGTKRRGKIVLVQIRQQNLTVLAQQTVMLANQVIPPTCHQVMSYSTNALFQLKDAGIPSKSSRRVQRHF